MKKNLIPRYYQKDAFDAFMDYTANCPGKHPLIVLPTGSGKSLLIAMIIEEILSYRATRVLILTHQKELIRQNCAEFCQNTSIVLPDVGVYSAGLKSRNTHNRVLFAGIQSVYNKVYSLGAFDAILIDEAHRVPHKAMGMYRKFLDAAMKINSNIIFAGLTATPYRLKGGLLTQGVGEEKVFDDICYEVSIAELIDANHPKNKDKKQYLCTLKSKNGVASIDTSQIKTQGSGDSKEFILTEMQKAFDVDEKVVAAVKEIVTYTEKRKKTIIFASGVEHCTHIEIELQKYGKTVGVVHSLKSNPENENIINDFKQGEINYLVNIGILCLDSETEILTNLGFKSKDDLKMNDKIAEWDVNERITFGFPKTIVKRKRFHDEKMVSFGHERGYSASIRTTGNHRMVYSTNPASDWKVMSALDCANSKSSQISIPAFGSCKPEDIQIETKRYKQSVKQQISATAFNLRKKGFDEKTANIKAVEQVTRLRNKKYKNPSELTTEECFLIGFWLGDGSKSCGRVSISQSLCYLDNVEKIDDVLKKTKITHSKKLYKSKKINESDYIRWTLARGTGGFGQSCEKGYFEIEPYLEKDGTLLFFGLNKIQLESLLYGLYLADGDDHHGNRKKTKAKQITATNYNLFNILQAVCSMRGISATIVKQSKPIKNHFKQQYTFSYGGRKNWTYTPAKNIKIEEDVKDEDVWCVTSRTSYIICRRRGRVFVTGNTTGFNEKSIDCIVLLHSTLSPGLYVQEVGRGLRLHPEKEDCLILDFGHNIERHGAIDKIFIEKNYQTGDSKISVVPQKECPKCHSLCHVLCKECPDCGFEFPVIDEINHDTKASESDIISKRMPLLDEDVKEIRFSRHEGRNGKKDSLRVDYYVDVFEKYSEWVCIEHEGFAKQKALQFLNRRVDFKIETIDEAIANFRRFLHPSKIRIDLNEQYPRIVAYCFDPPLFKPEEIVYDEELDDIPF